MDIEFIKKAKNELEFKIKNQDSAFFDIVLKIASSKRDVEFVSKKRKDNLEKEFSFYIRTRNTPAKEVLLECIDKAEEELQSIIDGIIKNISKIENK